MSKAEGVTYIFAWHSLSDACEKCRALDGKEWRDQDLFGDVLWDVFYGDLWDLHSGISLAHPNCRCQLEVRVIVETGQIEETRELATLFESFGV